MSRSKTDKSLEKYSKADLIWIIKAMLRRHTGLADRIAIEIAGLPAADVEPVVYGYWEQFEYRGVVRCSVCKDAYIDEDWLSSGKWGGCPNCRAKMDLAPPEGDSHG